MGFETGIPGALQRYGLDVDVVSGWQSYGSSSFNPGGVVGHHTAGPKTGDRPSLSVCVNGRPDLPGPLCNVFLPRGLTTAQQAPVVVAAGRANHAGEGGYHGLSGNSSVFGIEAEDDGVDGIWTQWQLWAYPRVVAGLLWLAGREDEAEWYCSHRTWAPERKIDPTGISDSWMRSQVNAVFNPPASPPEDEMPLPALMVASGQTQQYYCDGNVKRKVVTAQVSDYLQNVLGLPLYTGAPSAVLSLWPTVATDGSGMGLDAATQVQAALPGITAQLTAILTACSDDATVAQLQAVADAVAELGLAVDDDATSAEVAEVLAAVEELQPATP